MSAGASNALRGLTNEDRCSCTASSSTSRLRRRRCDYLVRINRAASTPRHGDVVQPRGLCAQGLANSRKPSGSRCPRRARTIVAMIKPRRCPSKAINIPHVHLRYFRTSRTPPARAAYRRGRRRWCDGKAGRADRRRYQPDSPAIRIGSISRKPAPASARVPATAAPTAPIRGIFNVPNASKFHVIASTALSASPRAGGRQKGEYKSPRRATRHHRR